MGDIYKHSIMATVTLLVETSEDSKTALDYPQDMYSYLPRVTDISKFNTARFLLMY